MPAKQPESGGGKQAHCPMPVCPEGVCMYYIHVVGKYPNGTVEANLQLDIG